MAIARPILGLAAIALLAGGIVMQFFIVLSGLSTSPENLVYFLQSSTNGIANAPNPARWTYLALCGVSGSHNANCGPTHAAFPFNPVGNFGTSQGVPDAFVGNHYYYYMSRFAWSFYIVALFFAVVAFFVSGLALFARLGAYLSGLFAALALFFQSVCASLMTAWTVQARNHLRAEGQTANLGTYAYGFTWATWAAFLLATILFCIGGSVGKEQNKYAKTSYFGRKRSTRSTRSRGSFIDGEQGRRGGVKDEYVVPSE